MGGRSGGEGVTRAGVRLLPHEQRLARGAPLLRGDDVGFGVLIGTSRCRGPRLSWPFTR